MTVTSLDIRPYIGALPLAFGMSRAEVHSILGAPQHAGTTSGGAACDHWGNRLELNTGYDGRGRVNHVGIVPGRIAVSVMGSVVWTEDDQPDPNLAFLRLDPAPLERVGFLVFTRLGVTTTGYHDDDEGQRAITVFPRGAWDDLLKKAMSPDLTRYNREP